MICLFVWDCSSRLWRCHNYRLRAANFDLCWALMAIWGFFRVPHLLWHGPSAYNGHLRGPGTLTPIAERLQWSCYYLFLRIRSRLWFEHPIFRLRGENPLSIAIINIQIHIYLSCCDLDISGISFMNELSQVCYTCLYCLPIHTIYNFDQLMFFLNKFAILWIVKCN